MRKMEIKEKLKKTFGVKEGYEWKKTAKKFAWGAFYAVVMAAITYSIQFMEAMEVSPGHAFAIAMGVAFLKTLENFLKHRKDEIIPE
jgi:hypothetical protein